jgi:hypothetical protein
MSRRGDGTRRTPLTTTSGDGTIAGPVSAISVNGVRPCPICKQATIGMERRSGTPRVAKRSGSRDD